MDTVNLDISRLPSKDFKVNNSHLIKIFGVSNFDFYQGWVHKDIYDSISDSFVLYQTELGLRLVLEIALELGLRFGLGTNLSWSKGWNLQLKPTSLFRYHNPYTN